MTDRELLRHALATLAYRGAKALRDAPPSFANYDGGGRAPLNIVSHLGDLMEWSVSMADGSRKWHETAPTTWEGECTRFFAALKAFDDYLATDAEVQCEVTRLFQGPIADALTHVGQLAMLRRMAGAPTLGENYFAAQIETGRVGPDQAPLRRRLAADR
ncbi:MAG TPA: hypothetical protein VJZ76_01135 [Thermoanaerobaculia bacterium]|nr:hypothetical protein [Thermoanaerobaculia bacterium]